MYGTGNLLRVIVVNIREVGNKRTVVKKQTNKEKIFQSTDDKIADYFKVHSKVDVQRYVLLNTCTHH